MFGYRVKKRPSGPSSVGRVATTPATPALAPVTESTPGQKRKLEHSLRYYFKRHKADTVARDKPIAILQKRRAEADAPDAPPTSKKVRVQDTEGKKCEDSEETEMARAANTTIPTPQAVPTAIPKPTAAPVPIPTPVLTPTTPRNPVRGGTVNSKKGSVYWLKTAEAKDQKHLARA